MALINPLSTLDNGMDINSYFGNQYNTDTPAPLASDVATGLGSSSGGLGAFSGMGGAGMLAGLAGAINPGHYDKHGRWITSWQSNVGNQLQKYITAQQMAQALSAGGNPNSVMLAMLMGGGGFGK